MMAANLRRFPGRPSFTRWRGGCAMPGRAAKVVITQRQQHVLQLLTHSSTCPQALACRAQMILLAFDGWDNEDIVGRLGYERHQVGRRPGSVGWAASWRHGCPPFSLVPRDPTDRTHRVCVFVHHRWPLRVGQVWSTQMRQGRHNVSLTRMMACSTSLVFSRFVRHAA